MAKKKYSLKDLKLLPKWGDKDSLSSERFNEIAAGIIEHSQNCYSFIMPKKLRLWCKGLGCTVKGQPCTYESILSDLSSPSLTATSTPNPANFFNNASSTLLYTVPRPLTEIGYNGTCYDDYLCDAAWMGNLNHTVLGLCAFVLCLIGVLGHTLCIPAFNFSLNRSGTTLYMTGVAVADIIYLILQALIVVIYYFPAEYIDQLRVYGTFSGYLVPYGVPLMELCELMTMWFIVVLLFDRYLYLKFGYYSKTICTKSLAAKAMIAIFSCLGMYTIPKFFEYHIVSYGRDGLIQVLFTEIGLDEIYQNMMTHWLKVPIEMFLPNLAVAVLTLMVIIKLIDTHTIRQKKANLLAAAEDGNLAREPTEKELFEKRENSNTMIAMWFGILLLIVKVSKFALHVLITEKYILREKLVLFELTSHLLDVVFAFCKPFICLCLGQHFCKALGLMFCCRSDPNYPTRKQPVQVEMKYTGAKAAESEPLNATLLAGNPEIRETEIQDCDDAVQSGQQCA